MYVVYADVLGCVSLLCMALCMQTCSSCVQCVHMNGSLFVYNLCMFCMILWEVVWAFVYAEKKLRVCSVCHFSCIVF